MFSRRPGFRFNRGRVASGVSVTAAPVWRPFGYGGSLVLDLAAQESSFDHGFGGIAGYHDSSSYGYRAEQPDIARQPSVSTVDGEPAVFFDAAQTQWLDISAIASAFSGVNVPWSVLCHLEFDSPSTSGCLLSLGNTGSTHSMFLVVPNAGTGLRVRRIGVGGDMNRTTTTVDPNGTHRTVVLQSNGAALVNCEIDGTPLVWNNSAINVGQCTFDMASIGCNRNNANLPDGGVHAALKVRRLTVNVGTIPDAAAIADWKAHVL